MTTALQKFAVVAIILCIASSGITYVVMTQMLGYSTGVQLKSVTHGYTDLLIGYYEVIYEMANTKYLEPQGINFKFIGMTGHDTVIKSLLAGTIDTTVVGFVQLLDAIDKGADVKMVYAYDVGVDFYLVVPKALGISSKAELYKLEGKKFAIHSPTAWTTIFSKLMFEEEGMTYDDLEILTIPGSENRRAALLAGQIDASMFELRDMLLLEGTGDYVTLASTQAYGDFYHNPLVVTTDWLETPGNKEVLDKIVLACMQAARDIYDDPQMYADFLATYMSEYPPEILRKLVDITTDAGAVTTNGGITKARWDLTVSFFSEAGRLDPELAARIDFDDIVYLDAINNALDKLGTDNRGKG